MILQRTKSLLRFLGLGHMRNMGAELSYRARVEFMLKQIFGDTFSKDGYWYMHPNPDAFFAMVMNIAGAGSAAKTNDGAELFRLKNGQSYEVNKSKLKALGVTENKLRELFAATPAADAKFQTTPTKPIRVPSPGFEVEDRTHDETEALVAIMDISKGNANERRASAKREAPSTSSKKPAGKRTKKPTAATTNETTKLDRLAALSKQVVTQKSSDVVAALMEDDDDAVRNTAHDDDQDDDDDDAIPAEPLTDLEYFDFDEYELSKYFAVDNYGEFAMPVQHAIDAVTLSQLHSDYFMTPAAGFPQCNKERYAEHEIVNALLKVRNDLYAVQASLENALPPAKYQSAMEHIEAIRDLATEALSRYKSTETHDHARSSIRAM